MGGSTEEPERFGYAGGVRQESPARQGALHVILLAISSLFLFPLVWMGVTSIKPGQQAMSMPPKWVPTATMVKLDGKETVVEKVKQLTEPSAIVIQRGGQENGSRKLLAKSAIKDGKALLKFTAGGREQFEPEPVPVESVTEVPKDWWQVEEFVPEFSAEREKSKAAKKWDVVPESEMKEVPHAFWSNYGSALNRMRKKEAWEGPGPEPEPTTWSEIKSHFEKGFGKYMLNTLFVCIMSVIGSVVSCTLVAYSFSFLEFKGRDILFAVTLATMMIPFSATMVPLFDVFRNLGWIGTFKPLWAPAWFGNAFFIFLLRQFFLGLPKDLLDAARIDGCSELEILWHVVIPLARPALAMVALFQFLGSWKDFMGPMLYLTDPNSFTLSVGLQAFQSQHGGTPLHLSMAASMMFSLPLIVLFLAVRKSFMQGIAMTGIKG